MVNIIFTLSAAEPIYIIRIRVGWLMLGVGLHL
jgi:hypothetical protein